VVFPVATYGCETWTLNKAHINKINAFEMWCWRRMLRIPWTVKRTNVSVREEIGGGTGLHQKVLQQKLSFFGHVVRSEGLERDVMLGMGEGRRGAGRPRRRWIDELREQTRLNTQQLHDAARDRIGWRRMVITSPKVDNPT